MPRPIPFPTKAKKTPETETKEIVEQPVETAEINEKPTETSELETKLETQPIVEETPVPASLNETTPELSPEKREMPSNYKEENCVIIDGKKIEIKPTKLTYFRNQSAATYNALKNIPLTEIFGIKKGVLDPNRDGDQIVYDFLVAVLDDKELVRDKYNEFNADQIEQMIHIFGRINHIDEKYENQRKNREAQGSR